MLRYFRANDGDPLPDIADLKPYRAIVIIEADVSDEWQWLVSKWLVNSGCVYMLAWGQDCSSWDDSVDWASIGTTEAEILERKNAAHVMTTWHEKETLSEVFEFATIGTQESGAPIPNTLLFHIGSVDREDEYISRFAYELQREASR